MQTRLYSFRPDLTIVVTEGIARSDADQTVFIQTPRAP
jgi:hypothetical protein